jgi:GNAT superfamily N-acetyltransferase
MHGPVTAAELARLEEFYWQRGAPVHVELCPLADPSLPALLAERGYRAEEYSNVLARPLHPDETATAPSAGVHVRVPAPDEAELWARTVAAGFAEDEEVASSMRPIFMTYFCMPAAACFLASVDGQPAGGGVVATHDGVAALFATSTLVAFRKRGVQAALIRARLDFAARAGCDVAMVVTAPGSTSQRNVERQGFHVMYTRTKMLRERDTNAA